MIAFVLKWTSTPYKQIPCNFLSFCWCCHWICLSSCVLVISHCFRMGKPHQTRRHSLGCQLRLQSSLAPAFLCFGRSCAGFVQYLAWCLHSVAHMFQRRPHREDAGPVCAALRAPGSTLGEANWSWQKSWLWSEICSVLLKKLEFYFTREEKCSVGFRSICYWHSLNGDISDGGCLRASCIRCPCVCQMVLWKVVFIIEFQLLLPCILGAVVTSKDTYLLRTGK